MPPLIKISKDDIVKVGYEMTIENGLNNINARAIAKRLNCSIQPIFSNFKTMEDLKKEITIMAYETYSTYVLEGSKQDKPYKSMGKAYIKFAQDYPKLFQLLFMSESRLNSNDYLTDDIITKKIYEKGTLSTSFNKEEMKRFHFRIWIFTHGIATMVATNTCTFTEEEIDILMSEMFFGLLKKQEEEEKNEKSN